MPEFCKVGHSATGDTHRMLTHTPPFCRRHARENMDLCLQVTLEHDSAAGTATPNCRRHSISCMRTRIRCHSCICEVLSDTENHGHISSGSVMSSRGARFIA